jgi:hypothetical protein
MRRVRDLWLRILYGSMEENIEEGKRIAAENVKYMLGNCPICKGGFNNHAIARFAVMPLDNKNLEQAESLISLLQECKWHEVIKAKKFNPQSDAVICQVLRCVNEELCWLVVREPYDIDDIQELLAMKILMKDESKSLASIIEPDKWIAMSS